MVPHRPTWRSRYRTFHGMSNVRAARQRRRRRATLSVMRRRDFLRVAAGGLGATVVGAAPACRRAREFGVRVTYDTYESNEELLAKLQSGARGYDLAVPSSYLLEPLWAGGLVQPFRRRHLANWSNLAAIFLDPPYDPGNRYTVPWAWGVTGVAWRRDLVRSEPNDWGVFFDRALAGRMTMMDDGREVLGAMLKHRGRSLNSTDPAELAQARADAMAAKANLRAYRSGPVKADLLSGDVWVAQMWNGDAAQAAREEPGIAFVVPREGAAIWIDSLVLLAGAPHPRAAHEFCNYVLRADVGAAIADATSYGSPNRAAQERQRRPIPYPGPDELLRLEYFADLGEATELYDRIWTEIKAA